ncbi:hypothetical protein CEXT_280151 [Caerostris extrusa]|uniref:Uncharacterized protein n=1 Tax=Caerostris extrusa TaxID=172846 RepID=A0AAV4XSG9_CAEEX|nr:hypothetical protein CEXT_280151 [Caerostris extrusa]
MTFFVIVSDGLAHNNEDIRPRRGHTARIRRSTAFHTETQGGEAVIKSFGCGKTSKRVIVCCSLSAGTVEKTRRDSGCSTCRAVAGAAHARDDSAGSIRSLR